MEKQAKSNLGAFFIEGMFNESNGLLSELTRVGKGYAYSFVRSRHDAEDVVQVALMRLWESRSRYDSTRSIKSWFNTIVGNTAKDFLRRRTTEIKNLGSFNFSGMDLEDSSYIDNCIEDNSQIRALDAVVRNEEIGRVHAEVYSLPDNLRETARLRHIEGIGYPEISRRQGIPLGTVKSRLSRTYEILKKKFNS
jgi:RNA polymerase sigma-70 factor, ECF subfamily